MKAAPLIVLTARAWAEIVSEKGPEGAASCPPRPRTAVGRFSGQGQRTAFATWLWEWRGQHSGQ